MDEVLKQILLPLLGGFLFMMINWRARFLGLRTTGEKIFLASAVIGVGLAVAGLVVARSTGWLISEIFSGDGLLYAKKLWRSLVPFQFWHVAAFTGGPIAALLLNRLPRWGQDESFNWALERLGDNLDRLLAKSRDKRKYLLLTLRSGRVYVGVVIEFIDSMVGDEYISFVPFCSGYRTPVGSENPAAIPGKVHFTVFYDELVTVIESIKGTDSTIAKYKAADGVVYTFDTDDIAITIPKCDIEAATIFDWQVYRALNSSNFEQSAVFVVNSEEIDRAPVAPPPSAPAT